MKQHIITSIDVGTSQVRCIVASHDLENDSIRVLGVGAVVSEGLRRGAIVDVMDASNAIASAVEKAEETSGMKVTNAVVSIGGSGIKIQESKGVVVVGRADGEVTEDDVLRVIEAAQSMIVPNNTEVIHVIPRAFRLDDQKEIIDPVGMQGMRLEVEVVVVEAPAQHVKNLRIAMERVDVTVDDFIVEPLAAAEAVLTKKQKELGVVLVVLGASTTSLAVFEEGNLLHTAIVPVGADFVTQDLAIGLRTSVEIAESVKIVYGSLVYGTIKRNDEIDLSEFDPHEESAVLHDHVIEIVIARVDEIFDFVRAELEAIGKEQLLPAGAVLVGGGANMVHIIDFAKESLQLPVQVGYAQGLLGMMDQVDDPAYATSVGLVLWEQRYGELSRGGSMGRGMGNMFGAMSGTLFGGFDSIKNAFRRFLP